MLNNGTLGNLLFRFRTLVSSVSSKGAHLRSSTRTRQRFVLSRRLRIFGILTFIFLFVLYFPRYFLPLGSSTRFISSKLKSIPNQCPTRPPITPYTPTTKPRFSWRHDLPPEKYPVESLHPLPIYERGGSSPPVQLVSYARESRSEKILRNDRLNKIRDTFLRSWNSYRERAWLKDELMPISGESRTLNMFGNGWAATLVDNLDTLLIMDLHAEFAEAVDAVAQSIHFGPPPEYSVTISTFETTIRHLGGLLSAYDLSGCLEPRLLDKAMELGDMLIRAFDNPSHMPVTRWDLRRASLFAKATTKSDQITNEQLAADNAIIAEFASFGPEFTRLSQLTGDMRYYDMVHRVAREMQYQQDNTKIPGIWPIGINAKKPDLTTGMKFGVGTMADSAFEYLAKMHALLGGVALSKFGAVSEEADFAKMYTHFISASVDAGLFFRPVVPKDLDILFTADIDAPYILPQTDEIKSRKEYMGAHLACFFGGNLALAGKLLSRTSDVELGLKLTHGCIWAYQASPFGIMPEKFELKSCDDDYRHKNSGSCSFNETLWEQDYGSQGSNRETHIPGMIRIIEKGYFLRPEAIESVFYAYRITGDPKYREIAWNMFEAIERWTATEFGNAALVDVTQLAMLNGNPVEGGGPLKQDSMESFWLAETLKYFYLIFSDESVISLDEWVLNTEAHPFRRPGS